MARCRHLVVLLRTEYNGSKRTTSELVASGHRSSRHSDGEERSYEPRADHINHLLHEEYEAEVGGRVFAQQMQEFVLSSAADQHYGSEVEHGDISVKLQAFEQLLGYRVDGHAISLSMLERLAYKDRKEKLIQDVAKTRRRANNIEAQVLRIPLYIGRERSVALLQRFVVEHFSPFKRYVLEKQYFPFEAFAPSKINPLVFMIGWALLIGCLLFFLYWIFSWGVTAGNAAFEAWGINFVLVFIQELLLVNAIKIAIIQLVAIYAIDPQLMAVFRVLHGICIDLVQGRRHDRSMRWNVIQHMSPACRASHMPKIAGLLSSRMLREVTDVDAMLCRLNAKRPLHILVLYFVAVPVIIGILNKDVGTMLFNAILPSSQYLFIMANFYLNEASPEGLIALYVCLRVFVAWYYRYGLPIWRRIREHRRHRRLPQQQQALLLTIEQARGRPRKNNGADIPTRIELIQAGLYSIWKQVVHFPVRFMERHFSPHMTNEQLWQLRNLPARFQAAANMAVHSVAENAQQMRWPEQRELMVDIPEEVKQLLASRWKNKTQIMVQCKDKPVKKTVRMQEDDDDGNDQESVSKEERQRQHDAAVFDVLHRRIVHNQAMREEAGFEDQVFLDESDLLSPPSADMVLARTAIFKLRQKRQDKDEVALAQSLLLYLAPDMLPVMSHSRQVQEETEGVVAGEEKELNLQEVLTVMPSHVTWQMSCLIMSNFLHTYSNTAKQPEIQKGWQKRFQEQVMPLTNIDETSGSAMVPMAALLHVVKKMVGDWTNKNGFNKLLLRKDNSNAAQVIGAAGKKIGTEEVAAAPAAAAQSLPSPASNIDLIDEETSELILALHLVEEEILSPVAASSQLLLMQSVSQQAADDEVAQTEETYELEQQFQAELEAMWAQQVESSAKEL